MPRRLTSDSRNVSASGHDLSMLRRAYDLAAAHHPHPNPRVGAVVVAADGRIVGEGAHVAAGSDHAEVVALRLAGDAASGGTLYVTLEPCTHHGRTPPCTDTVITSGISRVVVAISDPDDAAGGGADMLRSAGIDVVVGVDIPSAIALDPGYFHHRTTGRPRVTLKLAATIDGQVAAADGTSQWITGVEARSDAHRLRAGSDAVMVGAGTLRSDDPGLDARTQPPVVGSHPRPVVIAGLAPLPSTARVYDRSALVYAPAAEADTHRRRLEGTAAEVVGVPGTARVDLEAVLADLGERGILDLLVEGGPTLASSLLSQGLADRLVWYLAALVAGGTGRPALEGTFATLADARRITIDEVVSLGGDIRVTAHPAASSHHTADRLVPLGEAS